MATERDDNEIRDDAQIELTGERVEESHDRYMAQQEIMVVQEAERLTEVEARRMPDRPAEGASKPAWVDYCVALGAQREDLEEETSHHVTGRGEAPDILGEYVSAPYTKDELVALADRLGG